jgi:hypothetical protein
MNDQFITLWRNEFNRNLSSLKGRNSFKMSIFNCNFLISEFNDFFGVIEVYYRGIIYYFFASLPFLIQMIEVNWVFHSSYAHSIHWVIKKCFFKYIFQLWGYWFINLIDYEFINTAYLFIELFDWNAIVKCLFMKHLVKYHGKTPALALLTI